MTETIILNKALFKITSYYPETKVNPFSKYLIIRFLQNNYHYQSIYTQQKSTTINSFILNKLQNSYKILMIFFNTSEELKQKNNTGINYQRRQYQQL